ncbi:hypothetical protein RR46_10701 [Papilio xuthus]|uniref:dolichyl-P-Man:Man5GlcNAc2-PP-dolichol alpha-1,3-mannosyltransferase n=1 Tax=Papilio xuthus TaxID=66420 RepID=A0A194PJ38_PAPXU|nr:hypothetical protein RR46_10701 [Papilio xuthus]
MGSRSKFEDMSRNVKKMMSFTFIKGLFLNPAKLSIMAFIILIAELILNILIVERVPYTEIDWKAYMQECEGFLNGTLDYSELRGDTGPLVYPAGFKQVQPQIDAKNVENKRKAKMMKDKLKVQEVNEEKLTKDQEEFLNSFESMLQKTSNTNVKKKKVVDENEKLHYSINFEIISQLFILPMFLTNFIGVVCARSLHYQFYSWYFHSLPYLLWSTNLSVIVRFLILALIEFCWNTYPSTDATSAMLHVCHLIILYSIYKKTSAELSVASKVE